MLIRINSAEICFHVRTESIYAYVPPARDWEAKIYITTPELGITELKMNSFSDASDILALISSAMRYKHDLMIEVFDFDPESTVQVWNYGEGCWVPANKLLGVTITTIFNEKVKDGTIKAKKSDTRRKTKQA